MVNFFRKDNFKFRATKSAKNVEPIESFFHLPVL